MSDAPGERPAYERFGFDLLERAFNGSPLLQWQTDYARLFWQSLEVHAGGFQQWMGNLGKAGVFETLEALKRHSLDAVEAITREAVNLTKLSEWNEEKTSLSGHLEEHLSEGWARLGALDMRYYQEAERLDAKLQALYDEHPVTG
jgi:hypothetical protein